MALESQQPMQSAGTKTFWDRKTNTIYLNGNAMVRQPGEQLNADKITIDRNQNTLVATGNAVYVTGGMLIQGEAMDFNMSTRTGVVTNGRVSGDNFMLSGERINKLGDQRYQVHKGTYSTCLDCAQSWKLQADDVDIEIEGYAYMKNVSIFVKDSAVFWVPYLIIPVKTQRQTGLLFPKFGFSNYGFRYLQPFFWATGRSTDMTLGLGDWGGQGLRAEWEGRYSLSPLSHGQANVFWFRDGRFPETIKSQHENYDLRRVPSARWAVDVAQRQELPLGIMQKLRVREVSDTFYPFEVGDVGAIGDAYLTSDLLLSKSVDGFSAYLSARRTRSLTTADPLAFDSRTVQTYPAVLATTNDRFLFGLPIAASASVGATRFDRLGSAPTFDTDPLNPPTGGSTAFRPGQDPIRKATRVFYTPSLYTTLRPLGFFSLVPQAEYRGYFYAFPDQIPSLSRGYLLMRAELSLQLEKVYSTGDVERPRMKHLFRPRLTYSRIPLVRENDQHPFLRQIEYARKNDFSGYSFDTHDITPLDSSATSANYFLPMGDSLDYGFVTQLISRKGKEDETASYDTRIELNAHQTYDFRSLRAGGDKKPFSRMISNLIFSYDKWTSTTQYTYVPYVNASDDPNVISTSFSYTFANAIHREIYAFTRTLSLGFSRSAIGGRSHTMSLGLVYSINDYLQPSGSFSKDFNSGVWLSARAGLSFASPSRCWKADVSVKRDAGPCPDGFCLTWSADFSLNLSGSSFGGVSSVSPLATTR